MTPDRATRYLIAVTGAVNEKWVPMDVRRDIVKAVLVVADQEMVDAAQATVNYVYEGAAHERDALAAERDQALAAIDRVKALAESWRYKGEFGWGAWQEGHGPDQEGWVLDHAAGELRAALGPGPQEPQERPSDAAGAET